MFQFIVLCFFCLSLISNVSARTAHYEVQRGERPPIRFEEVLAEDYDPGVLIVRFSEEVARHLDSTPLRTEEGIVLFDLAAVDQLNVQYSVRAARQHFLSPALGNTFTERHRAWGFHLWYRLEVDERTDIVAMLSDYQRLAEVDIAEPSFRKELIGSHDESDFIRLEGSRDHPGFTPLEGTRDGDGWIPNDPQFGAQWHYHNTGQQNGTPGADISLPQAWEMEKGDTLVIVAVVDGGIDYNHPDLAGNMWYGIGYNFVNNSPNIEPHNHGTHVAGTVAAVNNNNVGVSGVAGGSGNDDGIRLMSAQVFASSGNGGFHIAPLWAADNGAAISQNSWGYTSANYYEQSVLDAIDYFNENGGGGALEGGITIFSAGNSNTSDPRYPGYYSGAFSVAATNNQDVKAWYSTFGDWVDVSAPGGETNTVTERGVLSTLNNNSYGYYQGTSMASPHVSGIVGLMLSRVYGELDAEDVAEILLMTTDNHYGVNPNYLGLLGSGRVNALEALILAELFQILPANPSNFEAIGMSDTEMSISWDLNDEGHDVLLAWSEDGQFGSPAEGDTYSAGDELPGGGIVLYAGSETSFDQDELSASTLYFYRIWSLGDDGVYSYGRNTDGRTQCGVEELPVSEAFGGGIPYCWEFEPTQGNWGIATGQGNPAPGMQFNWSPSLNNYSHRLMTAPYEGEIPGSAIALEFDLMLDNWSLNTVEYLSVEVWSGGEWHELMEFDNTGGDMAWDTHMVDLTPWALDNVFMVGFRAHGSDSYNLNLWVIDNINIFSYSCPPPYDLVAQDVDTESALIVWESVGEETQWDLIWGVQGFDPASGGTLVEGLTGTTYLLDGLDVFTDYDVYVRADCGEDDLSVWAGPVSFKTLATCPAPTDLSVSNIESTSAHISWTVMGEEGLWDILWGNTGFNPGSGGTLIEGVTENPFLLEGINAISTYDVYVRAFCSAGDESIWVGPVTFSTTCDVVSLPYLETFDGNAPDCWTFIDGQGNWGFNTTTWGPPSSPSGPPHASFHWSPTISNYNHSLVSPPMDATGIHGDIFVDYLLYLNNFNNNNTNYMAVEYKTIDGEDWTLLEEFSSAGLGSGNEEFIREDQLLAGMSGQVFHLRFRAHGENSFSINGWGLDDIHIHFIEDPDPEAFTLSFDVSNLEGEALEEVIIHLNGMAHDPGEHIFEDLPPGLYHYLVVMDCYLEEEGQVHISDSDKHLVLFMGNIPGDANNDGMVDVLDVTAIISYYLGEFDAIACFYNADVNNDGLIDVQDVIGVLNIYLHGSVNPYETMNSAEVAAHPGEDYLSIYSDGSIAGIAFEINTEADLHLSLSEELTGHQLVYSRQVNGGIRALIYHPDNEAFPAGELMLLHLNERIQSGDWNCLMAVNQNAEKVSIATYANPASADELHTENTILVYPNPAGQEVWVELQAQEDGKATIELYTLHGHLVHSIEVNTVESQPTRLDLAGVLPGTYFLQIRKKSGYFVRKLIIQ